MIERHHLRRIIVLVVLFVSLGIIYSLYRPRPVDLPEPIVDVTAVVVEPVQRRGFDEYRIERDRMRAEQMELLQAAALDAQDESRQEQLTAELLGLLKRSEREMQAESLLRAKGFSDAVVVLADGSANVLLPEMLESEEAALVGALVSRLTAVAMDKIAIIDGATTG